MAETTYEWTGGSEGNGLPWPTPGSPPDGSAQIKKLAESIAIYGTSRPDTDPDLVDAPLGSQYIYVGTDVKNDAAGARMWLKTNQTSATNTTGWIVTNGDTGWSTQWNGANTSAATERAAQIRRINDTIYVGYSFKQVTATGNNQIGCPIPNTGFKSDFRAVANTLAVNLNTATSFAYRNAAGSLAIGWAGTSGSWACSAGATWPAYQVWPATWDGYEGVSARSAVTDLQEWIEGVRSDPDHPDTHLLEQNEEIVAAELEALEDNDA